MAKKIIVQEGAIVKKSNILARASWSPDSVWESRIVAIVAAQVRKEDEDFHEYEIPVRALLAAAGKARPGKIYRELDRITDKAMKRLLKLKEGRSWTKYTLFSKCKYTRGEKKLIVRFDPDLKPHYLELKRHFTIYRLSEYLSLPSTYSQRIYEILRSWDDCVVTEIGLSELHGMFGTPPSLRKTFKDFRRRVLDKAHKDIHALTQMRYEWEAVTESGRPPKRGRKVVKIRFFMCSSSMAEPEPDAIDPAAKQDFARALTGCGIRKKTALDCAGKLEAQNMLAEAAALLPELEKSWEKTGKGTLACYVAGTLRKKYLQKPPDAGVADHEDAAVSFARTLQLQCRACVDDAMEITRLLEAQNELAAAAAILPEVKKSWKKTGGKTLADHVLGGLKQKFLQHSEDGK